MALPAARACSREIPYTQHKYLAICHFAPSCLSDVRVMPKEMILPHKDLLQLLRTTFPSAEVATGSIQQDIFWLQVPVNDIKPCQSQDKMVSTSLCNKYEVIGASCFVWKRQARSCRLIVSDIEQPHLCKYSMASRISQA